MCPLLTLSYLYEQTDREDYLAVCQAWVDFAMNDLPRTREGGFQHITIGSDNYMQLRDDTLYMTVLFVGRMGTLTGCDAYIQESLRQFLVHLKYLTDTSTGLFFHGYSFDGRHHFGKALWGRGNAWYTAGLVDYLDMITVPQGVRDFLLSSLEIQVEALANYQTDEGMWHTLMSAHHGEWRADGGIRRHLRQRQSGLLPQHPHLYAALRPVDGAAADDGSPALGASEVLLRAAAAKRVAGKHRLPFITLQDKFEAASQLAESSYWLVDGVHPTAMGHELIAQAWMQTFQNSFLK